MRAVVRVVVLALATTAAGYALMAAFADRLIFVPPAASYGPETAGLVRLPAEGGDTVVGVLRRPEGAGRAVLFLHGNAEDVGDLEAFLERYARLGVAILAVDYPGYGLSTGTPSEDGAYAAADAGLSHLGDVGFPPHRVVVHGRSLGGAVAGNVAARAPVAGLVLESTFTSAFRVMLPFDGLPGDRFRTLSVLPRVRAPVLVVHGRRDEVVAFPHGRRLWEAVPEARRSAYWVEGAGHNDLLLAAGEAYWERLAGFLGSLDGTGPASRGRP